MNRFFKLRRLDLITIRRKDTNKKFDVLVYYINVKEKKVIFRAHSSYESGSKFIDCYFMRNKIIDKANGAIITILRGTARRKVELLDKDTN